jgi:hypothetical protein
MLIGDTPDKNLTYTEMASNLMNGKINCGGNEEIRKILLRCFKKDLKERINVFHLLEAINNEIFRQENVLGHLKPTVSYFDQQPNQNNEKLPVSLQPLSPSEGQTRHTNKLMANLPQVGKDEIFFAKNQSPFKNKEYPRN